MKFHCDRCKTRYSIADERVRGKILKIRCKSCAAVITVREGMEEAMPGLAPSPGSTIEFRASEVPLSTTRASAAGQAVRPPARVAAASAQPVWYLSLDGEQTDLLTVAQARAWLAAQQAGAEIYAWREGFEDWKLVAEVPELGAPARPGPPAVAAARTEERAITVVPTLRHTSGREATVPAAAQRAATPAPAQRAATPTPTPAQRAATPTPTPAQRAATPAPEPAGTSNGASQSGRLAAVASPGAAARLSDDAFSAAADDDLDLDIGEPSRVVKLDMLMTQAAAAQGRGTGQSAALPGMSATAPASLGRGTGNVPALVAGGLFEEPNGDASGASLPDPAPRRRSVLPLVMGVVALLSVGTGALAFVMLKSSGDDADRQVSGNVPSDFENLGYQLDRPGRTVAPLVEETRAQVEAPTPVSRTVSSRTPRRSRSDTSGSAGAADERAGPENSAAEPGAGPLTPLSPDDVIQQSSRSQIGFQRCYERAKKKDPFLEVRNIRIDIQVNAAGAVSGVQLSSHDDTQLGACLKARIRTWKLRPSTSGINTQLSLTFER